MHEWSLLIFTLALQCAAGGVLALALIKCCGSGKIRFPEILLFTIIACGGTVFSLTHLGDMLGAYRALYRVGSSWLSREVWLAGGFAGLTVLCSFFAWKKTGSKALLAVAALVGLLAVFASSAVYATSALDKWTHGTCAYAEFFAAALLLGPLLVSWQRGVEAKDMHDTRDSRILYALFGLGALLLIINAGYFGSPRPGCLVVVRFALSGLGILAGLRALSGCSCKGLIGLAAGCLILGEVLGRYLFFME